MDCVWLFAPDLLPAEEIGDIAEEEAALMGLLRMILYRIFDERRDWRRYEAELKQREVEALEKLAKAQDK
jgi:hypothetical protein